MNLKVGSVYPIRNQATQETTNLRILEIAEYAGELMVYSQANAHQIWLPSSHGRIGVKERGASFVVLQSATVPEMSRLIDRLDGLPLTIRLEGNRDLPLINSSRTCGLWPTDLTGQAAHLVKSRNVIDVYHRWKLTSNLPGAHNFVKNNWRKSQTVGTGMIQMDRDPDNPSP